jgi:hypothetical protein
MSKASQLAKRLGARYVNDGAEVRIEAPPFHRWAIDQLHELVCTDPDDALERMAQGIEHCPDGTACDWCNDNRGLRLVR